MAYDEGLAERVRGAIATHSGVSERRMFGGLTFLVGGNMATGVDGEELIVRVGPEDAERALAEDGVREFAPAGRPMKGWVMVAAERLADDDELADWVDAGAGFAASLPPKRK